LPKKSESSPLLVRRLLLLALPSLELSKLAPLLLGQALVVREGRQVEGVSPKPVLRRHSDLCSSSSLSFFSSVSFSKVSSISSLVTSVLFVKSFFSKR
jgi:hypothetical protein